MPLKLGRLSLAIGAVARVSDDSLHFPGLTVAIIGTSGGEETGGQKMIRVRTSDRRTASLPPCFLEPVPPSADPARATDAILTDALPCAGKGDQ